MDKDDEIFTTPLLIVGKPSPAGVRGLHHLALCFDPTGRVTAFPESDDLEDLAYRLRKLVLYLVEHPSRIRCAAGLHDHSR